MKRNGIFVRIAVICSLLTMLLSVAVHAQETEDTAANSLTLKTAVRGSADVVDNGKAEVTLPDGSDMTVEGSTLPDDLLLVVEAVEKTDGSILAWLRELLKEKATNLRAYDIYFVDNKGERYEITGTIKITLSLDGGYTHPVIYYAARETGAELLESSVSGDKISFETSHNSYYVLGEKVGDDSEPKPGTSGTNGGNGTGGTSGSSLGVKTGDDTNPAGWMAAMAVSLGCLVLGAGYYRKRKKETGNS